MTSERLDFAKTLAIKAGDLGLTYFRRLDELTISAKGHQDLVSEADRDVETLVRDEIAKAYPTDGILGEEHGVVAGTSGYTWVIDPIDGTANFVTSIPQWCVVLSCVYEGQVILGVTHDPCHNETFWAAKGQGAFINGKPMKISDSESLANGSLGIGFNGRTRAEDANNCISALIDQGGVFFRNASGGLMLAYAASGRLIGYVESHMNAWDCLAGMLMVEEAGGKVEAYSADEALEKGTRVVVAGPGVYDAVREIAQKSFA
ncbi:inositol monophosphatase family protein [Roseibium sp. CAU 1637]|uniref:Inositol-1-monophosphatase n=1 Tax=Roseibium limicola TaxID=2816037 RepID=A0A939ERE1_9HYPH|nr:inositol monophosphatase family protein [Roseibium limicola]MBO0346158.1 inositol monophosphatase family protein [Roseibium limicola]